MTEKESIENINNRMKQLESILSSLDTGLSVINSDYTISWVNEKIYQMFPGTDPVGKICHRFYESSEDPCEPCPTFQCFKSGHVQEIVRFNPVNERWYRIISQPIKDSDGKVVNVLEGITDITEKKLAEAKLQDNEVLFKSLFEHHTAVYLIIDPRNGDIIDANPAAAKFYGWSQAQLRRMKIQDINSLSPAQVKQEMEKARSREQTHFEFRHMLADGSIRDVDVYSNKIQIKDQDLLYSVIHDNTDRKRAEAELLERVKELNCLYGISHLVESGKSLSEILQETADLVPDSWQYPGITSCRIVLDGNVIQSQNHCAEFCDKCHHPCLSRPIVVNENISGEIRVCYTEDRPEADEGPFLREERDLINAIAERIGSIVKQKITENALRTSEDKYRSLFEFMEEGFLRADIDGKITLANRAIARMFGYKSPDEMIGLYMASLYADSKDREKTILTLQKNKGLYNHELLVRTKNGKLIWTLCNIKFIKDNQGGIIGTEGLIRNINDRKQAEDALKISNRGLKVLKEAGKALLRARDEEKLIEEICRIIIEIGEYSMSWVGYAEESPRKIVKPVGSWGVSSDYLDNVNITWDKSATGQGPTGKAIRTQTVQVTKNIINDVNYEPWRNAALGEGFQSSIAIPIYYKYACLGALNIYSPEPDAFDEFEVDLLIKLANELAYGIISLRNKQAQHEAEKALRVSEKRYRRLAENSPDAICRMSLPDGKYEYMSPVAKVLFGYPPETWYKKPLFIQDIISPDWHSYFKEKWEQLLKGQVPPSYEYQIVHKDGDIRWINQRNMPVKDADGRLIALEGIVTDITERKHAEEALRESEDKFSKFFHASPVVMSVSAFEDGVFLDVNEAFLRLLRLERTAVIGKSAYELGLWQNSSRQGILHELERFGFAHNKEVELVLPSGRIAPLLWFGDMVNIQGKRCIIASGFDLTERRAAEEERNRLEKQLHESRKMESIGTLAGGIAHEFNNMLGIIIGNTELAFDDIPDWNPARDSLNEIKAASLRAKEVVRKLLSVARKTPESRKPIPIGPVIKESLNLLRRTIPTTIGIRKKIACSTEMILGDTTEINQVVINLCTNSVHAMVEGVGTLEVVLNTIQLYPESAHHYEDLEPGNYVRLSVRDTGEGIEPAFMDRLFDPYFTTKDVDQGLGMGLAIVHGIVKKHDGAIKIESKVGKGTTVEVLFPVIDEQAEFIAEVLETPQMVAERILLVDDEPSIIKMVTQMLKRSGYDVTGETSSSSALKTFKGNPEQFDLVISDMTMPEMAGDQLAQEIKQIRPDIPVILCTGHSERMDEKKTKEVGIDAFIMKPFSKNDLAKTIPEVFKKRKRQG